MNADTTASIAAVVEEVERQDAKWGEQHHPSFVSDDLFHRRVSYKLRPAFMAKNVCEVRHADGRGTWADIAMKEIAEAFEEPEGSDELYEELIQCSAVFAQWAADVKRKKEAA